MPQETLVLVPPAMCDARAFGPQILDLSRDHALLLAPATTGERMEEIASHILAGAPARFAVAGMGLGGMVALEIIRRAPERVTRLALIATTAQAELPDTAAAREPQIIAARSGLRWDAVLDDLARPGFFAPTPQRLAVAALMRDMAQDMGRDVFVTQSRALQRRRDQQKMLAQIRVPATVICGTHDGQFAQKRQQFLADMIPGAAFVQIADAGDLPTLEQAAQVTAALRAWMAARA